MDIQQIFEIIGGITLFLYGIFSLSKGLQRIAGEKMAIFLEKLTGKPIRGLFTGVGVTVLLQSSSMTMVTLIGLINAGLLNLSQGIGVMLGADIGTTVTAQIVVFKVKNFALLFVAIGYLLMSLGRRKFWQYFGEIIFGFGILFLGMNLLRNGVKPLQNLPEITSLFVKFGEIPVLGVLAAAGFTAVIQSSSVTTGIIVALSLEGLIDLKIALPLVLGANIGTTITAVLASLGGSSLSSKRVAAAQVVYNVLGVAIALVLLTPFSQLVTATTNYLPRQIANAHTLFNVISAAIALPLVGSLVLLVKRIIPGEEIKVERRTKYLDKGILNMPSVALKEVAKETQRMAEITQDMIRKSTQLFPNHKPVLIKEIAEQENAIDEIYRSISDYLVKLSTRPLTKRNARNVAGYTHAISEIERITDHLNELAVLAKTKKEQKLSFSKEALSELDILFGRVVTIYDLSLESLKKNNSKITEVKRVENKIDILERKYQKNHLKRLEEGSCSPSAGLVYVEILRGLERIGDHSESLAHIINSEIK